MKNFLLPNIFFLIALTSFSQELDFPLPVADHFKKAYLNGTRSKNGKPGEKYWQNHADYKIKVELDPKSRLLKGTESIVYFNESPDNLSEIVFRVYPDIFKKDFKRDASNSVANEDITENGVDISNVSINGIKTKKIERRGTNMFIILEKPLATKSNIIVEIAWSYLIPKSTHIREGIYFNSSYFVAYWYPQIAVYDDLDGWDTVDYTGQQEFYNDFNNFDVQITLSSSHVVWATGIWQNPAEILSKKYLSLYNNALVSDTIINIITEEDRKQNAILLPKNKHTYKYVAKHVPDFAFTASDTYLWDMGSVVVNDTNKSRTSFSAVYHPSSKDFYCHGVIL